MLVTPAGIEIEVRLLQLPNAPHSMLVTLSGIVIELRPMQFLKANSPMLVTGMPSISLGMTNSPSANVLQSVIAT